MSEMAVQTCHVVLPLDDAFAALVTSSLQTEFFRNLLITALLNI